MAIVGDGARTASGGPGRPPADPEEILAAIYADDDALQDPYPLYAALREAAPVHLSEAHGNWVCTRADDIVGVLRDPTFTSVPDFSQGWGGAGPDEMEGLPVELLAKALLFMDGDDHARLRGLVASAFTPRAVDRLRPRVEALVDDLLGSIAERGECELIADFAFPLPVIVICELLGVPPGDRDLFREQIPKLTPLLEWDVTPETFDRAAEAALFFAAYFVPLFEQRRSEPGDDLVSALVHAEIDGEQLDPVELLVTCILLLGAGHETTMNLLGNGTRALLEHPGELARLRDGDVPARSAVDELLRYDSPVQLTARRATADTTVAGVEVPAGGEALLLLGAANRDPAKFDDPDRLDLGRAPHPYSFGHGAHFCLGAALARLEGEVAVPALVRRFPGLALAGEARYRPGRTLRGLSSLPLTVRG